MANYASRNYIIASKIPYIPFNIITFKDWSYDLVTSVNERVGLFGY